MIIYMAAGKKVLYSFPKLNLEPREKRLSLFCLFRKPP